MMRKMLLLSIATVLTAVGVAGATSSGSANLAGPFCVDKANGTVHAVAANVACKSNQIRKSGLAAAAGTNGTNGTNGSVGPQGAQGGQGAKGDAGSQGVAGLKGADGATGP